MLYSSPYFGQVLPEGRAAVAIAAKGGKREMIEVRFVLIFNLLLNQCILDKRSGAGAS